MKIKATVDGNLVIVCKCNEHEEAFWERVKELLKTGHRVVLESI